ncbi:MAG: hypothetical protein VX417_08370, partial [SAR324 cluster bacterium]|nr:hypothetical protein [SAR324 cluster bacterium]
IPGIHNGFPPYALRMIEKGFRFVTVSSDSRLLTMNAKSFVDEMREGMGKGELDRGFKGSPSQGY